jgi:hypothetical protein
LAFDYQAFVGTVHKIDLDTNLPSLHPSTLLEVCRHEVLPALGTPQGMSHQVVQETLPLHCVLVWVLGATQAQEAGKGHHRVQQAVTHHI